MASDLGLADALAGVVALLASLLIGVAFAPVRDTLGRENVAILYMAVVATAAAGSGRLGGLIAATAGRELGEAVLGLRSKALREAAERETHPTVMSVWTPWSSRSTPRTSPSAAAGS